MKKRVIKIKESDVFNIIKKVINEQVTPQPVIISTNGKIGDYTNKFSGLSVLIKDLKKRVEEKLNSGSFELVPFDGNRVIDLKYSNGEFQIDVKLQPCDESKALRYFDMTIIIFSYANMNSLNQAIVNSLDLKAQKYGDSEGLYLNTYKNDQNTHLTYPLDNSEGFTNLNPEKPDTAYKVKIGVIVGKKKL